MTTLPVPDARFTPVASLDRWRLEIEWPDETIVVETEDFLALPDCNQRLELEWKAGIQYVLENTATFTVTIAAASAFQFIETIERLAPAPPTISLHLLLDEESIPIYRGTIDSWTQDATTLTIRARQDWPWNPRATLCRDLSLLPEGIAAGLKHAAWLPQVFGEIARVPSIPLFRTDAVRSLGPFPRDETALHLAQMPDWPPTGRVQLDDEVFSYGALQDNPPRLEMLTRTNPRDHASGRVAHPMPADSPAWIAADHPADLLQFFIVSNDEPLSDFTTEQIVLSGRATTAIRLDELPLARRYSPFQVHNTHDANPEHWEIDDSTTNCLVPEGAFATRPAEPAQLLPFRNVLHAQWNHNFLRDTRRHDRLKQLYLHFEFCNNPYWRHGTELHVKLTRGDKSYTLNIYYPMPFDGEATFQGTAQPNEQNLLRRFSVADSQKTLLIDFDDVSTNNLGDWNNIANVTSGGFALFASHPFAAELPTPLHFALHRRTNNPETNLSQLGLFTRVRADRNATVRLSIKLPNKAALSVDAEIGTSWTTVGQLLDANILYDDLHHQNAAFELALLMPAALDVASVWIEANAAPTELQADAAAAPLSLAVTGEVRQSIPFLPVRIDFSPIIDDLEANGWETFVANDPGLHLRIELVNAPAYLEVGVRNIHWELVTQPASSIAATSDLVANIRGRLAEADGFCKPGAVVEELLLHSDFAAIPVEELDTSAIDDLHAANALFGRRFAAAIYDNKTLHTAIQSAMRESCSALAPSPEAWKIVSLEKSHAATDELHIGDSDILVSPMQMQSHPPKLQARTIRFARQGIVTAEQQRGAGTGAEEWPLSWLERGHRSLADFTFARFGFNNTRIAAMMNWSWVHMMPASQAALNIPSMILQSRRATTLARQLKQGELRHEWDLHPRRIVCWTSGDSMIWREVFPPRLVLQSGGTITAEFHPGELRLRGILREHAAITPSQHGVSRDVDGSVVFTIISDLQSIAIMFTTDGDLLLPNIASESQDLQHNAPECSWSITNNTLVLGTPELGPVATLSIADPRLLLSGIIRENSLV